MRLPTIEELSRRLAQAPQAYRRRGALRLGLLAARDLLRPAVIVRLVHVYETTLARSIPAPPPTPGIELRVVESADDPLARHLRPIADSMTAVGRSVSEQEVAARFARGDSAVAALAGDQVVGFLWLGRTSVWERPLQATFLLADLEARHYHFYRAPGYAQEALADALVIRSKRHARDLGCQRTVSWTDALHVPSANLRGQFDHRVASCAFAQLAGQRPLILGAWPHGTRRFVPYQLP